MNVDLLLQDVQIRQHMENSFHYKVMEVNCLPIPVKGCTIQEMKVEAGLKDKFYIGL